MAEKRLADYPDRAGDSEAAQKVREVRQWAVPLKELP